MMTEKSTNDKLSEFFEVKSIINVKQESTFEQRKESSDEYPRIMVKSFEIDEIFFYDFGKKTLQNRTRVDNPTLFFLMV